APCTTFGRHVSSEFIMSPRRASLRGRPYLSFGGPHQLTDVAQIIRDRCVWEILRPGIVADLPDVDAAVPVDRDRVRRKELPRQVSPRRITLQPAQKLAFGCHDADPRAEIRRA